MCGKLPGTFDLITVHESKPNVIVISEALSPPGHVSANTRPRQLAPLG